MRISKNITLVSSWFFSAIAVVVILGGLLMLFLDSLPIWEKEGAGFITGQRWFFRQEEFGAGSMIYGSIVVALIAILIAAPIGIAAAVFGVEFLPQKWRMALKVTVELLAGVPSVVYGLLGVLLLRNWIYDLFSAFDINSGDTLLTAGILLGVMILPTVMTLSDDALRSIPGNQRTAARGLGLNSSETALYVTIPQATPSLIAAVLLGIGRALGETIAVFLVIGRQDNQWPDPLIALQPLISSGQTLSSKLGGAETNIAYGQPLHWGAITGLGLLLLSLVVIITLLGIWLRNLTIRRYEA